MLCDKCKKKNASFYYEENINGTKRKLSLCADCARELRDNGGLPLSDFSPFSLFGEPEEDFLSALLSGASSAVSPRTKRCELCGLRFSDIVNSGKVGCPMCYSVFSEELRPTIDSIHGNCLHNGRKPKKLSAVKKNKAEKDPEKPEKEAGKAKGDKEDELSALKKEMQKAISEEAFEKAASLRDKIKQIEGRA